MRKPLIFLISALLLFVFLFNSCTKDEGKAPVVTPPPVESCDTITYTKHIKKIMDDYCVSCHKNASDVGGVGLTTYAEVKNRTEAGRIKERVIDGKPTFMPQGGELSAAQKQLITCWINKGMKE